MTTPVATHHLAGWRRGCHCGDCRTIARERVLLLRRRDMAAEGASWEQLHKADAEAGVRR